jgi:hypothetical protein
LRRARRQHLHLSQGTSSLCRVHAVGRERIHLHHPVVGGWVRIFLVPGLACKR